MEPCDGDACRGAVGAGWAMSSRNLRCRRACCGCPTGCQAGDQTRVGLLLPDGKVIASEAPDKIGDMPVRLIALGRDSAAIVSRE